MTLKNYRYVCKDHNVVVMTVMKLGFMTDINIIYLRLTIKPTHSLGFAYLKGLQKLNNFNLCCQNGTQRTLAKQKNSFLYFFIFTFPKWQSLTLFSGI